MKNPSSFPVLHSLPRSGRWLAAGLAGVSLLAGLALAQGKKLTPPPDLAEMEALDEKVQAAENIPPEAKAELHGQATGIKIAFNQNWTPLETAYEKRLSNVQEWQSRWDDRSRRGQAHDSAPHQFKLPEQQGAFNAYNNERDQLMAESERLRQEKIRMDEAWKQEWALKAQPYDAWRARDPFGKYKQVAQAMLDGRMRFKKGKAWDQLVESARGAGNTHAVVENSSAATTGATDARGVQPWAPGEREKELLKPRVQPYFGAKKAAPPPPPPPSTQQ